MTLILIYIMISWRLISMASSHQKSYWAFKYRGHYIIAQTCTKELQWYDALNTIHRWYHLYVHTGSVQTAYANSTSTHSSAVVYPYSLWTCCQNLADCEEANSSTWATKEWRDGEPKETVHNNDQTSALPLCTYVRTYVVCIKVQMCMCKLAHLHS